MRAIAPQFRVQSSGFIVKTSHAGTISMNYEP
jgi:hypothetical protein